MRIPTWWPALIACAMLLQSSGVAQERVPLCAGLTIVGAVSEPEGDYEPIITLEGVDTAGVRLRYTADAEVLGTPFGHDGPATVNLDFSFRVSTLSGRRSSVAGSASRAAGPMRPGRPCAWSASAAARCA